MTRARRSNGRSKLRACRATARLARRLSLAEQPCEHDAECAYLAGLLHGVGRLVYRLQFPEKYQEFVEQGALSPARAARIERALFGASSGELGAYMLGLWGLSRRTSPLGSGWLPAADRTPRGGRAVDCVGGRGQRSDPFCRPGVSAND